MALIKNVHELTMKKYVSHIYDETSRGITIPYSYARRETGVSRKLNWKVYAEFITSGGDARLSPVYYNNKFKKNIQLRN